MVKRIEFSRKTLDLEDILRLIFFDKTSSEFDESLHEIIGFLRNHPYSIRKIGRSDENPEKVRAYLKLNYNSLTCNELTLIDSISY